MKSTTAKSVIDPDDLEENGDEEHEGVKPLITFDWENESENDTTEELETSTRFPNLNSRNKAQRFYVKSILEDLKVLKMPFLPI